MCNNYQLCNWTEAQQDFKNLPKIHILEPSIISTQLLPNTPALGPGLFEWWKSPTSWDSTVRISLGQSLVNNEWHHLTRGIASSQLKKKWKKLSPETAAICPDLGNTKTNSVNGIILAVDIAHNSSLLLPLLAFSPCLVRMAAIQLNKHWLRSTLCHLQLVTGEDASLFSSNSQSTMRRKAVNHIG